MNALKVLGGRGLREALRTPDALLPTLLIPLFFLVVNVGQAARIFPSSTTDFLNGQGYAAFQVPVSLLLAASFHPHERRVGLSPLQGLDQRRTVRGDDPFVLADQRQQ